MSANDYNPNRLDAVLSRIETKLDATIKEMALHRDATARDMAALRKDVNALQAFKWWLMGVAAAAGATAGKVVAYFTKTQP